MIYTMGFITDFGYIDIQKIANSIKFQNDIELENYRIHYESMVRRLKNLFGDSTELDLL